MPNLAGSDEAKQTIARALAETGQVRTWNLMVDVIAQTGQYTSDATNVSQANKFIVRARSGIGSISRLTATMELCLGVNWRN